MSKDVGVRTHNPFLAEAVAVMSDRSGVLNSGQINYLTALGALAQAYEMEKARGEI